MTMSLIWFCLFWGAILTTFLYRAIAVANEKEVDRLKKENFRLKIGKPHASRVDKT